MVASTEEQLDCILREFWLTLALVGVPGVLGGLTNGISIFLKSAESETGKWPPSGRLSKWSFYGAQGITGLGGSLAALLVTLWANRFPKDLADLQALLTLTCTGFVSGYVANRLLPAIADSLYKKLTELTEQQAVLEKKIERENKNSVDLSTELTRAKDYLSGRIFIAGQTKSLLESLSSLAKTYPKNRVLHILLSRTWNEASQNRKKALQVLEDFIQIKLDAGEVDEDLATAYWNSANYFEEDFQEAKNAKSRTHAIEALRQCLHASPSYFEEFLKDEDFKALRESPEGQTFGREYKAKHPEAARQDSAVLCDSERR